MARTAGMAVTKNVTLVRLLGRGGMGEVWIGRHGTLDMDVAVKFVNSTDEQIAESLLERFRREAALAAKIKNPHAVKMFDHGTTESGDYYIVMELLEGETLGERLRRHDTIAPAELAEVLFQVAAVLDEAHSLGVIHRDIKPDNIFLCRRPVEPFAKLLDFGIAKQQSELAVSEVTTAGAMVGTPEFMSPEQLLSTRTADSGADLWSLAVVAYRGLFGQMPFTGATLPSLSMAICQAHFTAPSQLEGEWSASVDDWFARCFSTEAATRFSSAGDMALAFSVALQVDFPDVRLPRASLPPELASDGGSMQTGPGAVETTTDRRLALAATESTRAQADSTTPASANSSTGPLVAEDRAAFAQLERRYRWVASAGAVAAVLAVILAVSSLGSSGAPAAQQEASSRPLPSGDPWLHAKTLHSATPPPPTPTPVPATVASASPSAPVVNPSTSATGRSRASHVPRPRAVGRNNNPGKQPVSPVGDPRKEPPAKPSNCYFIDENGRTAIDPRCL